MTDHVDLIRRSLAGTGGEFDRRVRAQADRLGDAVERGEFDNEAPTLGLELEVYAVETASEGDGDEGNDLALSPIPEDVFAGPADKELGVHNAELNAAPSRFDDAGIEAQAEAVAADLEATRERAREHGLDIVLDAMPAVGPAEGTVAYLDDVEIHGGDGTQADNGEQGGAVDGESEAEGSRADGRDADRRVVVPGGGADDPVVVARNMRRDPRYGALDNEAVRRAGGSIPFDVPGAELSFRTILFESLATSVQPHVQVPDVEAFPTYHNYAVRTLGPLLALSANSPFLPGDCYDVDGDGGLGATGADDATDPQAGERVADPAELVAGTHHELRVAAFEESMNQGCRKVRVPADLEEPTDAVEHVVDDDPYAPFLREWIEGEDDGKTSDGASGAERDGDGASRAERDGDEPPGGEGGDAGTGSTWEFDYKRGSFWRWVRGVAGGDAVPGACDEQSLRVEYRPLPTQPTVRDTVGLQVLTAGLLHGLVAADHPLLDLSWEAAEESFYAAVEDGPDADLAWITSEGERTDDTDTVFAEVFDLARQGLDEQGVSDEVRDRFLSPLVARWEAGATPSVWKKRRVRSHLEDGRSLEDALAAMQREYVDLSREHETFADWL